MKNKRILSLVLAFAMILGTFSFAFAAAPEDVVDTEYEAAVNRLIKLGALGGYPDGTFKPDNQITREEFAAALIKTKGLKTAAEAAVGLPSGFTDVPATRWSSGYVGLAANLGIVKGIGNDKFAPTNPVKYEQAVTMIIRALGYEEAAKAKGGYPLGYLIVANDIGLLDSVKGTQGVPALRGAVAQLLDNALEIPMMIQAGYGSQTMWVVSGTAGTEKQTLLGELGFDYTEGRVANASRNRITIGEGRDSVTLTVDEDFDFNYMEGLTIEAWHSGGKLVVYSALEDAIYAPAEGEGRIYVDGTPYKVAKGAFIEVNNEEVEKVYADYAKVLLNVDNEIIWLKGYTFEGFLVVAEVDENVVYDYDKVDVNLKGYTILKDGKTITVEDIEEEEDILLYNRDEGFAIVYNDSKVGEIDRVYSDVSFRLDDTRCVTTKDAMYLDGEYLGKLDEDVLASMMDEEEKVEVFFNTQGEVVLVKGNIGEEVTSAFYGLVTYSNKYNRADGRSTEILALDILNEKGKTISYDIRKDSKGKYLGETSISVDDVVLVTVGEDEDPINITVLVDSENIAKAFKPTDSYVGEYKLQGSTVIFYDGGEKAVKLEDAENITKINTGKIYVNKKTKRILVVVADTAEFATEKYDYVTNLVARVRKLRTGETEFTFINGDRYTTQARTGFDEEYEDKIVTLGIGKESGLVNNATILEGKKVEVISRNARYGEIETDNGTYELVSGAKLFDESRGTEIRLIDLEKGDKINVYFDTENASRFVAFVVRLPKDAKDDEPEVKGVVTYIDGTTTLTKTLVLDAVPAASKEIKVMYNNTGNKDVLVEKDSVTVRLIDTDNGTVVRTATAAADKFLAANLSTELGKIDLNGTPALVAGGNYEVRAYLNGEQLDAVAKVYIKSDNADAKKVTVKGVEANIATPGTATVKLPVGTDLTKLAVSDVVVTKDHAKATVGDITIDTTGDDLVVNFVITAENGTDKVTFAITVTVLEAPEATAEQKAVDFTIASPANANLAFTINDGKSVTGVKLGTTTLKAAEYNVNTTLSVDVVAAALTQYVTDNSLEVGDTITATVTFEVGGSLEYTITLK